MLDCVNVSLIRRVHEAVDINGRTSIADERFIRLAKIKMSSLLREIGGRMNDHITGRGGAVKFVLYSGHDTTVDPLATALGVADGRWPRYALFLNPKLPYRFIHRSLVLMLNLNLSF